jgi:integrase
MARAVNRLNAVKVAKTAKPGRYADGLGLYLFVGPAGNKSWVFRYRRQGRLHDLGLGATHTVSLSEARAKALSLRKMRVDGRDPLEERAAKRAKSTADAAKAMTFEQCAEAYIASHRAGWRNAGTARQWSTLFATYVFPKLGALPVQTIDVALVMRMLEPIWTGKPTTAGRVRAQIESVLDWATAREYRTGENPARWKGHLDSLLPRKSKVRAVAHHTALPYSDVPAFLVELRNRQAVSARTLEFVILTAARAGEVLGARWDEMDLAAKVWTVPAERMKAGREHRVPLSGSAIALLDHMSEARQGDFVFPGSGINNPIDQSTMRALLKYIGRSDVTIHGFRSSFRDWAAERTNFPREVCEAALAHAVDNATEAAYRRSDLFRKRQQLMEAWARFCSVPAISGDVVTLRA